MPAQTLRCPHRPFTKSQDRLSLRQLPLQLPITSHPLSTLLKARPTCHSSPRRPHRPTIYNSTLARAAFLVLAAPILRAMTAPRLLHRGHTTLILPPSLLIRSVRTQAKPHSQTLQGPTPTHRPAAAPLLTHPTQHHHQPPIPTPTHLIPHARQIQTMQPPLSSPTLRGGLLENPIQVAS